MENFQDHIVSSSTASRFTRSRRNQLRTAQQRRENNSTGLRYKRPKQDFWRDYIAQVDNLNQSELDTNYIPDALKLYMFLDALIADASQPHAFYPFLQKQSLCRLVDRLKASERYRIKAIQRDRDVPGSKDIYLQDITKDGLKNQIMEMDNALFPKIGIQNLGSYKSAVVDLYKNDFPDSNENITSSTQIKDLMSSYKLQHSSRKRRGRTIMN
eukprot:Nk52_evm2s369 gene=Nk52_evmTU2s369